MLHCLNFIELHTHLLTAFFFYMFGLVVFGSLTLDGGVPGSEAENSVLHAESSAVCRRCMTL